MSLTSEMTRIVRDYLYDEWDSGVARRTTNEILTAVDAIRGHGTSAGAIRRSLRELKDAGLVIATGKGRSSTYQWNTNLARPADYQKRTPAGAPQLTTLPSISTPQKGTTKPPMPTTTTEDKRAILRQKLRDRMNEITGQQEEEQNQEEVPAPKKNGRKGITTANGKLYMQRSFMEEISDVEALRKFRERGVLALLSGPPGTGKTALVEAAFSGSKGGLFVVTADENTGVEDFLGQWSPTGNPENPYIWVDGPLVLAMKAGGVLFVDDATLANPKVLAVMYPAMDGRGEITVKSHIVDGKPEVVKAAKGFYVVAAHNPGVHGAILTDALASRFTLQIWVETDLELAASLGVTDRFLRLVKALRTERDKGMAGLFIPQLRELLAARDIAQVYGELIAARNLLGIVPEDDRDVVADKMRVIFGNDHLTALELGGQL